MTAIDIGDFRDVTTDARSPWLRPLALAVVVALHMSALFYLRVPKPEIASPVDTIEIDFAPPQGEATPENQEAAQDSVAQPEVAAETPPPDPAVDPDTTPPPPDETPPPLQQDPPPDTPVEETMPPPPEPPPPVAAELPKVDVEDAPVIAKLEDPPKPAPKPKPKIEKPRPKPQPAIAQSAARARSGEHSERPSAAARATYASRVKAAIGAHMHSAPSTGSVVISFTVGSGGGMIAARVASSSGSPAVDAWAERIVRSAHPGPPPGGVFASSVRLVGR